MSRNGNRKAPSRAQSRDLQNPQTAQSRAASRGRSGETNSSPSRRIPSRLTAATGEPAAGVATRSRRKVKYRLFQQGADLLCELLPARLPIDVRLAHVRDGIYGYCGYETTHFRFWVSSRLSQEFAIDVLIHEWAHALAWPRDEDSLTCRWMPISVRGPLDHNSAWGRAYAKVYSTVRSEILPRLRKQERAAKGLSEKRPRK